MPSTPDLTPEEIAAVLEARRLRKPVEDEIPASLAARLDREVAARVQAELAAGRPAPQKQHAHDGRVLGIVSLVFSIPLMGIVEGTTHGNLGGAAIVMAGVVLVNVAHARGRGRN